MCLVQSFRALSCARACNILASDLTLRRGCMLCTTWILLLEAHDLPCSCPAVSTCYCLAAHLSPTKTSRPLFHLPCAVEGKLKGFDTLVNLVLDECIEYMRGMCQVLQICAFAWSAWRERSEVAYARTCSLTTCAHVSTHTPAESLFGCHSMISITFVFSRKTRVPRPCSF